VIILGIVACLVVAGWLYKKGKFEQLRTFFAIICFGLGTAFAVGTIGEFQSYSSSDAWLPAMLSGMFLLGSFLLLRRKMPPAP
jgi:hypothetical protein